MDSGEEVKVVATDPGSVKDFASLCNQTGDELLESKENEGKFIYRIKKANNLDITIRIKTRNNGDSNE